LALIHGSSKVSWPLENVQISVKCSFQLQRLNSDFSLHLILNQILIGGNVFLHERCFDTLMSILWIMNGFYMSLLRPWRWICGLKVKCFNLTGSWMPILIPADLSFGPFKLVLWTVFIGKMLSTSMNGLIGHVGA
jgi:hypothetical protein